MASAKENLEDLITCAICYERFTDPRQLPCLHALCLNCIQDIHLAASNNPNNKLKDTEFRCPKCQAVSVLPGNSINNLPKFFHAANLADIVDKPDKNLTKKYNICGVCNEGRHKVTRYCFTCIKVLCKSCHTHWRYNSHVCVEVVAGNFKTVICGKHNELIEAYCTDCGVAVCNQCLNKTHAKHDIHDFIIQQMEMHDLAPDIFASEASCKQQISRIENIQKDFNANIYDIHEKITSHTDKLIAQILKQDNTLHAELDKHRQATNRELDKMKKKLADLDKTIALVKVQTCQLIQPIRELEQLGLHNVDQLLTSVRRNIPPLIKGLPECTYYQFIPQFSFIDVGKVIQRNNKGAQKSSESQPDTVPDVSADTSKLSSELRLVSPIKTGGKLGDMAWTPDGELLVVARGHLNLYSTRGVSKTLPSALSVIRGNVLSVAIHARTQSLAAIAGYWPERYLYVMSLRAGQQLPYHLKLLDLCSWQIRFTMGGDLLLGGTSNTLIKYNINLTQQWQRNIKHPAESIAVSKNKIIICGDNKLSVLSEDGRWLSSFPGPSDTHRLPAPRGVCTDISGNIYVVDGDKCAAIMFGPDGKYMRDLFQIKDLSYLAMYNTKYMAVIRENNQEIMVYQL